MRSSSDALALRADRDSLGVLALASPALAAHSSAQLWSALGGRITCGIAIHRQGTPPSRLLCAAAAVPAPSGTGTGDPGFVFLGSGGRPMPARLSQDSFVASRATALRAGSTWGSRASGPVRVACTIAAGAVRCANRAGHGFTVTGRSYTAF